MREGSEQSVNSGRKYALFLGCYIPTRVPSMEKSARIVLSRLDLELVDIKNASCCPDPIVVKGIDQSTWLALAARNLCLAEEMDLDILTLCNGCFETLKTANILLNDDSALRKEINLVLSKIGREFKGTVQVKHLIDILREEKNGGLKGLVEKPLTNVKVAVHYGCHLLRPSRLLKVDDPFNPTILDELVEGTIGAKSIQYRRKMWCCGAPAIQTDQELSLKILREKLKYIRSNGADCITLTCPFCQIQFDMGQILIKRRFKEDYNIPVLSISQLLGLAMNINPSELGLTMHSVKAKAMLEKIGSEV